MTKHSRSCLIQGGTVVSDREQARADVLVTDGRIVDVGPKLSVPAGSSDHEVIDATGRIVLPGVIDPQVHFRDPGYPAAETFETGTRGAALGGVTTVFDMPNTNPTTTTLQALADKRAMCASKAHVNWALFFGYTGDNLDACAAVTNVPAIKVFMAQSTGPLLVDDPTKLEALFAGLPPARIIAVHAEDQARIAAREKELGPTADPAMHAVIRDDEACAIATRFAMAMARKHVRRTHILHVSTALECEMFEPQLTDPSSPQKLVTSECTPNHLLLDTRDYPQLGNAMRMNPSIKTLADREALWAALRSGRLDLIATDHAPHPLGRKARGYWQAPSGMPSIQNSLPLLLNEVSAGNATLQEVVRWMCVGPAHVYGLARKGAIAVGMDADIAIVDMDRMHTIKDEEQATACKWSPYSGRTLKGWPVITIVGGHTVWNADTEIFDDTFRAPEIDFSAV